MLILLLIFALLYRQRDEDEEGKAPYVVMDIDAAFDEEVETLKAIDAGEIHGTVVQQPYEFVYQSIKALRSIIIEGKSPQDLEIPDTRQKFIATKMIRKGGGEAYLKKCQEWKSGS